MTKSPGFMAMAILFAVSLTGNAQPPAPTAQLAAMKKTHFLVGEWKGDGWMEFVPGQKTTFRGTEIVRQKAGGIALAIEGKHLSRVGSNGEDAVVHDAFAVITFDEKGKKYRFQGVTARGNFEDTEAKVTDGQVIWGMKIPQFGDVRFTIKLDDKGRWFEIGEVTQDGTSWRKFFEMTLARTESK